MGVIDVTNLCNGEIEIEHLFKFPLLAPAHTNVTPHNPYIRDTMLVVSYYDDGTQVFNIGDPLNVQPYAHYDTYINTSYVTSGNWGTYPYLPSGNIISSDIRTGLYVMQINDYDFTQIDYTPTFPSVELIIDPSYDVCSGIPAPLLASGGYEYYQWYKDGERITNSNTDNYIATEPGEYYAIGLQGQKKITSNPFNFQLPEIPSLSILGEEIEAQPQSGSFDWLRNNTYVGNAPLNSSTIRPDISGYYQIERTANGCTLKSDSIYFFQPRDLNIQELDGFYTRFISGQNVINLSIESNRPIELNLNIYNAIGQSIFRENLSVDGFQNLSYDTNNWTTGIYFITLDDGREQDSFKVYVH